MDGWMIAMHGFPYIASTIILGNHHWVSEMKMSSTIINIEYKAFIFPTLFYYDVSLHSSIEFSSFNWQEFWRESL